MVTFFNGLKSSGLCPPWHFPARFCFLGNDLSPRRTRTHSVPGYKHRWHPPSSTIHQFPLLTGRMSGDEQDSGVAINNLNLNRDFEMSATESPPTQPIKSPGKVEPTASTIGPEIVVVPRSERRGLLGRFSVIPEITNPREYGNGTKWAMTVIVSFAAITSSTGSSIFFRGCYCLFPCV